MGLFGFWKRQSESTTPPTAPAPASADPLGLGQRGKPRCGHYAMAHYALRTFALENPLHCLAALASPRSTEFFASLLEAVKKNCAQRGEAAPDFAASDLTVTPSRVAGYPVAVVQFPTPRAITEAFMTAVVLLARPEDGEQAARGAKARYFTLEKGANMESQADRTVLGEWTMQSHSNYGTGPAATVADFLGAVEGHLPGRA